MIRLNRIAKRFSQVGWERGPGQMGDFQPFRPTSSGPGSRWSLSPDTVVKGLIASNVVVWGMWQVCDYRFMMNNFTLSKRWLNPSNLHTIFTSSFSHIEPTHLLFNMVGLYSFGISLAQSIGSKRFMILYIGSALCSSFSSLIWQDRHSMSVGASGAVLGTVAASAMYFPNTKVAAFFVIPLKIRTAVAAFAAFDVVNLFGKLTSLDSGGHLGGMLYGFLFAKYVPLARIFRH